MLRTPPRATCALDMWAFGLIVFELFSRQPFFADKPDTMQQLASYAELEVPKDVVDDVRAPPPTPIDSPPPPTCGPSCRRG